MDEERARQLLQAERAEVEQLLSEVSSVADADQEADQETGDSGDSAQTLVDEGVSDAVEAGIRARLDAIERAEQRLAEGRFGLSVRSGEPIPDERLEVEPTAELTVAEASEQP